MIQRPLSVEEISAEAKMTLEETRRVMKISKHPISLDRPIGDSDDSYFGDNDCPPQHSAYIS